MHGETLKFTSGYIFMSKAFNKCKRFIHVTGGMVTPILLLLQHPCKYRLIIFSSHITNEFIYSLKSPSPIPTNLLSHNIIHVPSPEDRLL